MKVQHVFRDPVRTGGFSTIDNESMTVLSPAASGCHRYMMSKPDGWEFKVAVMMREMRVTEGAVWKLLKELRIAGYVAMLRGHDEAGHWDTQYLVRETLSVQWVNSYQNIGDYEVVSLPRFTGPGNPRLGKPESGETRYIVKTDYKQRLKEKVKTENDSNVVVGYFDTNYNNYPGLCERCGVVVEAGQGILVGKKPAHRTESECENAIAKKKGMFRRGRATELRGGADSYDGSDPKADWEAL